MSRITQIKPIGHNTLETNAYGGCYIDERDFEAREKISENLWKMYDLDDEAIEESGPLYQFADRAMVEEMSRFFYR